MVANIGSGHFTARARSLSFVFVNQFNGVVATPQSVTPVNSFGIRYNLPSQAAWAATTSYAVGYNARPVLANGLKYICTTAGTSGSTQPTFPTTIGATVVDGTVTWTCAGADGNESHLFEFFVAGANPLVDITVINSTVSMSASVRVYYSLSIRTSATGIHFSVNGEPEVEIPTTATINGVPAFIGRNDTSGVAATNLWQIRHFGFYAASRF
jgi:hypothetical protein